MTMLAVLLAVLAQRTGDPARFFDYDRDSPLDFRVASEEMIDGMTVQDVSYLSARKGRVPGYLVGLRERVRSRESCTCIGVRATGRSSSSRSGGAREARCDLAHDRRPVSPAGRRLLPLRRRPRGRARELRPAGLRSETRARRSRGAEDVDPKRIGYVGHSLGATWGGALAGIDPEVRGLRAHGRASAPSPTSSATTATPS